MNGNPEIGVAPSVWTGGAKRLVRKYAAWTLLVTVFVMGAAIGAAQLVTPTYVSAARVVVESRVTPNTTPLAPDMGTEKQVAQSGVVLETAAEKLGIGTGDLDTGLTVDVSPDTSVLEFAYAHPVAEVAENRAREVSVAYVDYRNSAVTHGTSSPTMRATLVTRAGLPGKANGRPVAVYAGVGALAGLTLGLLTSLLRDRMDDSLRGPEDAEQYAATPVLAMIPSSRTRRAGRGEVGGLAVSDPDSPSAVAIRHLRTKVQTLAVPKGGATLLIASPAHGDGRTTVALNLAAALAASGARVVLVEDGVRFGIEDPVRQLLTETVVPGLKLLRAELSKRERDSMPEPAKLRRHLTELRSHVDYVVLDSGPVSTTSDAMAFAGVVDMVLVVAERHRTTRTALATTVRELRSCEGSLAGLVVNVADRVRRRKQPVRDPYGDMVVVSEAPYVNSTPVFQTSSSNGM